MICLVDLENSEEYELLIFRVTRLGMILRSVAPAICCSQCIQARGGEDVMGWLPAAVTEAAMVLGWGSGQKTGV